MATKRKELETTHLIAELPVACADEDAAIDFFERKRWGNDACNACCGNG